MRALEHAASRPGKLRNGAGLADRHVGAHSALLVVDALFSGTHESGSSHRALLRAFVSDSMLARADSLLAQHGYRTHEFGDSLFVKHAGTKAQRRGGSSHHRCSRVNLLRVPSKLLPSRE